MVFVTGFMGFLAFLSGYVVSLEDRFQRDGKFCPFSVRTNLKASPSARKNLTWFGLLLWVVAAAVYVCGPQEDASIQTGAKLLGGIAIVYGFMVMGYARELEFKKTGSSTASFSYKEVVDREEWAPILLRAGWGVGKILVFFVVLYVVKLIVNA